MPEGYRFVPTRDGVGVLAPMATFGGEDPEPALSWPSWMVNERVHGEAGMRALRAGIFGSAMLHLREAYVLCCHESPAFEAMVEAYRRLGREEKARRLIERSERR